MFTRVSGSLDTLLRMNLKKLLTIDNEQFRFIVNQKRCSVEDAEGDRGPLLTPE